MKNALSMAVLAITLFSLRAAAAASCDAFRPLKSDDFNAALMNPALARFNFTPANFTHFQDFEKAGGKGDLILSAHPAVTLQTNPDAEVINNIYFRVRELPHADRGSQTPWLRENSTIEKLQSLSKRVPIFLVGNTDRAKAFVAPIGNAIFDGLSECKIISNDSPVALFISGDAMEDSIYHETVHVDDRLEKNLDELRTVLMKLTSSGTIGTVADREAIFSFTAEQRAYTKQLDYLKFQARQNRTSLVGTTTGELSREDLFKQMSRLIPRSFAESYGVRAKAALARLKERSLPDYELVRKMIDGLAIPGPLEPKYDMFLGKP